MRRFEDFLIGIIIIFLSIHLFITHSKLLFHLNPDNTIEYLNYTFSFDLFSQDLIVPTLSALAYSLITALILTIFVKYKSVFLISVISFAILDGLGVFVYYNVSIQKNLFIIIGSAYYALYTIFIIVSLGMFRNLIYKDEKLNNKIDNAIIESDVMQLRDNVNNIMNNEPTLVNDKYILEDNVMSLRRAEWSQSKIAKELNISQSKVSRILKKYKDG